MVKKTKLHWNVNQSDEQNIMEMQEVILWLIQILKDQEDNT
jgi:hypothetical protein